MVLYFPHLERLILRVRLYPPFLSCLVPDAEEGEYLMFTICALTLLILVTSAL